MQNEATVADAADAGGHVIVEVIRDGKHGPQVIQRVVSHNLIVNSGKRQTWRKTMNLNANHWDQMRIGINSAAANSGNTNVNTAVTGTLNTVDSKSLLSGTRTARLIISYPSGGGSKTATVKEVVVLNQNTSPGGSCFMRAVLSPVAVKTTQDKLRITYQFRIT